MGRASSNFQTQAQPTMHTELEFSPITITQHLKTRSNGSYLAHPPYLVNRLTTSHFVRESNRVRFEWGTNVALVCMQGSKPIKGDRIEQSSCIQSDIICVPPCGSTRTCPVSATLKTEESLSDNRLTMPIPLGDKQRSSAANNPSKGRIFAVNHALIRRS